MIQTLLIEQARRVDFPAVQQVLTQAALPSDGLEDHLDTLLVVRADDGSTIGCAGLELYGDQALLRSVALDAAYRGQGKGRRVIEAIETLARTHRVRQVYLLTNTARDFFLQLGYEDYSRSDFPVDVRTSAEFCINACATAGGMRKAL
jgi:amino-acid N-acetyltransferase